MKETKYIQTKIAIYIVITCNFIIVLQSYYNENTVKKEKTQNIEYVYIHTFNNFCISNQSSPKL